MGALSTPASSAIASTGPASPLRQHDGEIRIEPGGDAALDAGEGAIGEAHADGMRQRIVALAEGQRADRFPGGDAGQPAGLHRAVARQQQRFARAIIGQQERRARGRRAAGLGDDAEFDEPEPQPAVFLGDRQRGPALFDAALPEAVVVVAGLLEQRQQARLVVPGGKHPRRLAGYGLLCIVIEDRHAALPAPD